MFKIIALYDLVEKNSIGKKYELKQDEIGKYVVDTKNNKVYLSEADIEQKFYTINN